MILDARAAALLESNTHLRRIRKLGVNAVAVVSGRGAEIVVVTSMPENTDMLAASIRSQLEARRPIRFVTAFEDHQTFAEANATAVTDRVIRASQALKPGEISTVPFAGGWVLVYSIEDSVLSCDIHTNKPQDRLSAEITALAIPHFRYVGIQMAGRWAKGVEGDTTEEILTCLRDQEDEGWMPLDEFPRALARALADALQFVGSWGQGDFPAEGLPDGMALVRSKGLNRTENIRIVTKGAVITIDLSPSKEPETD